MGDDAMVMRVTSLQEEGLCFWQGYLAYIQTRPSQAVVSRVVIAEPTAPPSSLSLRLIVTLTPTLTLLALSRTALPLVDHNCM